MTAHELARRLLAEPDLPVLVRAEGTVTEHDIPETTITAPATRLTVGKFRTSLTIVGGDRKPLVVEGFDSPDVLDAS